MVPNVTLTAALCMYIQVKDDVDLILNAFCKPDTFTVSEKVRLGVFSPAKFLGRLLSSMPAPAPHNTRLCSVLPVCFAHPSHCYSTAICCCATMGLLFDAQGCFCISRWHCIMASQTIHTSEGTVSSNTVEQLPTVG